MTRKEILAEAEKCVCTDRNGQYGEPEDNFGVIADLWNVYIARKKFKGITSADVAVMMALFKIGRMTTAQKVSLDSFVDAIGYLACAGEIETRLNE